MSGTGLRGAAFSGVARTGDAFSGVGRDGADLTDATCAGAGFA
jgi:hypothetical protein